MKIFYAIKKPIPVKFIDPLTMSWEEIKSFNIEVKDGKWYMGTLEHKAYEFSPETHLIVEGARGERYAIEREIFKETYKEVDNQYIQKVPNITEMQFVEIANGYTPYTNKSKKCFFHKWKLDCPLEEKCVKCGKIRFVY